MNIKLANSPIRIGIGILPRPRNIMARPKLAARRSRPMKSMATTAIRLTYTPPIRPIKTIFYHAFKISRCDNRLRSYEKHQK